MKARDILAVAYKSGIVPTRLHGITQHKTLQARISEDIIGMRDRSQFFRTAPGRFFLREFLTDSTIPEEWRQPVPTRRRVRELQRGPALAVKRSFLNNIAGDTSRISPELFFSGLDAEAYNYVDPKRPTDGEVFVRAFVCVQHDSSVLSYRVGRYRDDRDAFMRRRSVGFATLVNDEERTLFNFESLGILDSGLHAAMTDLDFPHTSYSPGMDATLECFIWLRNAGDANALLAVIKFQLPGWFEPVKRRLALNELAWFDTSRLCNNLDDFDPWSRAVLQANEGRL